ncbi:MAG: 3-oxoacyl-[acyl-carrier-protein] synthase III C-terminal domain-containing protein [Planctomycetota bacterium]
MRIESISAQIPSRKITNDDILASIQQHSHDQSPLIVQTYLRIVQALFKKAGSDTRFVLDPAQGETAFHFIKKAMTDALEKAHAKPADIDLLIFCGVGKGFKEPANAYFYAKALGMSCSCFDIADACMSWVRALEVAYHFLRSGQYRRIMIINGEFNTRDHGYPHLYRVRELAQLEYTFPMYTIGEAASATVLSASNAPWTFDYHSVPELCDLCTISLEGFEGYVEKSDFHNKNGTYKFVSYGKDLFESAAKYLPPLARKHIRDIDEPLIAFPHAASDVAYLEAVKLFGVPQEKIFAQVFPRYGNIVSASIPTAISMAHQQGLLNRGDRAILIPASAGMSFAVVQFTY